jgi:uncharacterized membrane protein
MKSTVVRRLIVVVIAVAALAAVAAVFYHVGANHGTGPVFRGGSFRGGMMGWGDGAGFGLFGLIGLVLMGVLVLWFLAAVLAPDSRSHGPVAPPAGELDRLHDLTEMHTQGELTDEEFSAAKRKLLGLQ